MSNTSILAKVQSLYSKNDRVKSVLKFSTSEKKIYSDKDGVPLDDMHPLRTLIGLPCLPFNKIVQVAGKPDTGKSTVATATMVAAQNAGFKIIAWDTEEKFDPGRYEEFGGTPGDILFIRTNEITLGGQLVKDYINAIKEDDPKAKVLLVWDSVGGGVSRADAEINRVKKKNAQPAQAAKENGQVTRDIITMMNTYRDSICVYMANQTYAKIGFMQKGDKAKGGDTIEFFSSIIVFFKRLKVLTKIVDKKLVKYGIITQATVTKNHLSQGETSVHQTNFEINSSGIKPSDFSFSKDEDEDVGEEAE